MAREIRGAAPSGTLYARIMSPAGLWWNGSSFEAYSAGNYSTYDIAMTEQGGSGFYVADFPTLITTAGSYSYVVHKQADVSPAEGDTIINTGSVDWTGTSSAVPTTGGMTGSEWQAYVLRCGFRRTDKDAELYEATTDTIQDMRRRFMFDEAEEEKNTTDTISVLGDFKLDLESDFGLLLGVIVQDGTSAVNLKQLSKKKFDEFYPDINVNSNSGFPKHFCIYAGQIYIGPIPDSTSYTYRKSYSLRAGAITSSSTGVPFTDLYRDILVEGVLSRLYEGLQQYDLAAAHGAIFESKLKHAVRRETENAIPPGSVVYNDL